ncbi:hypothetical protein R1flu_027039 [Riccia fluitans]|uniref:Plant heme peroxidase family profile domain-containing protein n=1 Tax=Riccia fluitans TaxID=41844 RepID=A0ABD1XHP6_9MARC
MANLKLIATLLLLALAASSARAQLSDNFYSSSCPNALAKVKEVVGTWISSDSTLAPSLLRLHFHDCWIRGCDGSVLLDTANGEKSAFGNVNSLRGFEVIDDIKTQVEALCPGVVSCSDILATAARDGMVQFSGAAINWAVQTGRRDGVVSSASEANADLPPPFSNFNSLVSNFQNKGFTSREMIVLSGSHTVGRSHCSTIQSRLYNFSSTASTDPSMDSPPSQRL